VYIIVEPHPQLYSRASSNVTDGMAGRLLHGWKHARQSAVRTYRNDTAHAAYRGGGRLAHGDAAGVPSGRGKAGCRRGGSARGSSPLALGKSTRRESTANTHGTSTDTPAHERSVAGPARRGGWERRADAGERMEHARTARPLPRLDLPAFRLTGGDHGGPRRGGSSRRGWESRPRCGQS
jgi:hypothetical protein